MLRLLEIQSFKHLHSIFLLINPFYPLLRVLEKLLQVRLTIIPLQLIDHGKIKTSQQEGLQISLEVRFGRWRLGFETENERRPL